MADVLIYTANFGGYDTVRDQVAQDIDVDWLCITEPGTVEHPLPLVPPPWQHVTCTPKHDHPNLAAKVYKAQPPWMGDWKVAIWIDANMEITEPSFARQAISYLHDGVALWQHPRRDCVYDEADASLGDEGQDGRYELLPIREQMAAYRAEGFPAHHGLYATGTTVWTPAASATLGAAWLAECERWGFQDQLSMPVVAWRLGVEPGVFGIHQVERRHSQRTSKRARAAGRGGPYWLGNRWLRIWPHAREAYR